jgi:hypothetical protein
MSVCPSQYHDEHGHGDEHGANAAKKRKIVRSLSPHSPHKNCKTADMAGSLVKYVIFTKGGLPLVERENVTLKREEYAGAA